MFYLFAVDLNLGTGEILAIAISVVGFIVMFGLSSAKGDYQGLINTTLKQDELKRKEREVSKKSNLRNK